MAGGKNMTVHSVPFDLGSSNYDGIKEKKIKIKKRRHKKLKWQNIIIIIIIQMEINKYE